MVFMFERVLNMMKFSPLQPERDLFNKPKLLKTCWNMFTLAQNCQQKNIVVRDWSLQQLNGFDQYYSSTCGRSIKMILRWGKESSWTFISVFKATRTIKYRRSSTNQAEVLIFIVMTCELSFIKCLVFQNISWFKKHETFHFSRHTASNGGSFVLFPRWHK